MKRDKGLLLSTCAVLTLASLAASTAAAETKGPVTDDLGVLAIPKGAPIQIGAYWVMSGADSALGIDEQRGVEIAIKDQGGTLLGHPIKLNTEDDGCGPEGGQTAATKLAANPNTVIVLGPANCSFHVSLLPKSYTTLRLDFTQGDVDVVVPTGPQPTPGLHFEHKNRESVERTRYRAETACQNLVNATYSPKRPWFGGARVDPSILRGWPDARCTVRTAGRVVHIVPQSGGEDKAT